VEITLLRLMVLHYPVSLLFGKPVASVKEIAFGAQQNKALQEDYACKLQDTKNVKRMNTRLRMGRTS
jgi:hypothetical protein